MTSQQPTHKYFRIADDLHRAARAQAKERGETVTDVVRRCLAAYVDRPAPMTAAQKRRTGERLIAQAIEMELGIVKEGTVE